MTQHTGRREGPPSDATAVRQVPPSRAPGNDDARSGDRRSGGARNRGGRNDGRNGDDRSSDGVSDSGRSGEGGNDGAVRVDDARFDRFYDAVRSRDARFDGRFFTAVRSTGIYCRSICPARLPDRRNVTFYACAAAAEGAGYRPCLRCRPDAAPGSPEWRGTFSTVARGLRLIADGALDEGSVEELAGRLGVGARHLHRLFVQHLGAPPVAVAQTRRVHLARRLLEETDLTSTEIAFAAGFASVRRFHAVFQRTFAMGPQEMRARRRSRPAPLTAAPLCLALPARAPFDWTSLLAFLGPRCVPGLETTDGIVYRRRVCIADREGWIEIAPRGRGVGSGAADANNRGVREGDTRRGGAGVLRSRRHRRGACDGLELRTDLPPSRDLLRIVERARDFLDLEADTSQIGAALAEDAVLAPLVRLHPGARLPGAWDGFELGIRAVLGQQISVAGAHTICGRLVAQVGRLTPERVANADLGRLGIPQARANTLRRLAETVLRGDLVLEPWADPAATRDQLRAVPGIGPWTAEYIAMRALRDPDAFPASDLGVRKALGNGVPCTEREAIRRAEAWRPWRAYAVMLLWRSL